MNKNDAAELRPNQDFVAASISTDEIKSGNYGGSSVSNGENLLSGGSQSDAMSTDETKFSNCEGSSMSSRENLCSGVPHSDGILSNETAQSEQGESSCHLEKMEGHDICLEDQQNNHLNSSENGNLLPSKSGNGVEIHESSCLSKSGINVDVKKRPTGTEISSLNTITAMTNSQTNDEFAIPGPQRADALESLLELCARLLREDKLDELAGIVGPFGEETVSSRERAMRLTKSTVAAQKSAREL